MKKFSFFAVILTGTLMLNACLSGGGYLVAHSINPNLSTLEDYKNLRPMKPQDKQFLQELSGEYEVIESYGNITYRIQKVSLHASDNKVYILTYMKNRSTPSYKVEFSTCHSIFDDFNLRDIGQPNINCSSSTSEFSSISLAKTTANTTARLTNEEEITSIFSAVFSLLFSSSPRYTSVTSPYVMKVRIWGDAGSEPVLGLRKIK